MDEFGFLIEREGGAYKVASNDGGGTIAYSLDEVRNFMLAKVVDWITDLREDDDQ